MDPDRASWQRAWESALDDLELTLEETARLLSHDGPGPGTTPWQPPEVDGPLPPEMLDRARSLLARQQQLILATQAAMEQNRRSRSMMTRITEVTGRSRGEQQPVYLDVRA